jgi:hypothetical protein
MKQEKISDIDKKLCLYFIFQNSIAFRDFFVPQAFHKLFNTYYYQYAPALSTELCWGGARGTGKSYDLEFKIVERAFNSPPGEEHLLTSFRRSHIKDRMERVISLISLVPYLRQFLVGDTSKSLKSAVTRTPVYSVRFKNGTEIAAISVGEDPQAVLIQGRHPVYRYIEEAGFYPQEAYMKFQNTQAPSGSKDCFYGIPNGRLDSPFFEMMHKLKKFKNKRFRVHRALEPNWTQELKREKLSAFKTVTSNDWLQEIEAQDGTPAYGYWSEVDIRKNIDFTESAEYPGVIAKQLLTIAISAKDYEGLDPAQALNRLPQIPEGCEVILGIDAGYSQPTVILPFYFYQKKWNLQCKIMLTDRMISDDQTELIDYIANFYKAYLGIDTSSADGRDIASALCNPKNAEYANEQYDKRVFFIDFRAVVVTSYKKVQRGSDPENIEIEELKEDLKMLTSKVLRDKFYNVEFNILYDEDFIPDFLSETQKRIAHHEFTIYTPANVHVPEACRAFVGAWWFLHVKIEKPQLEEIDADEEYGFQYPKYQETPFNLFGRGKKENDENLR